MRTVTRIFALLAAVVLFFPSFTYSQSFVDDAIKLSFVDVQTTSSESKSQTAVSKVSDKRIADGAFWTAVTFMGASKVFDIESTFYNIGNGAIVEANPLMRPFINNGRHATYLISAAAVSVMSLATYELKKQTKWWWVLPVGVVSAQTWVGIHNIRITRQNGR
ncbi:MAG: hypothetical protein HYX22_03030 [Candidatus Yanofskybacteria bacterium]|nr:hypothetical protein [Candidatus Yanofskybacteria bacterium]